MKFYLIILAIASLFSSDIFGQTYYFRHYQVENGLSNNTVFSCVQDKNGFMWFGTKDGLNRFDGTMFKIFRNDAEDSLSLGDNFIRSLYVDRNNTIFIGTRKGVYKYDSKTEKFSLVYNTNSEIRDIKKDAENTIWFISGETLIAYNELTGAENIFSEKNYFSATSVCINENNEIWVASSDGRLMKMNSDKKTFSVFDLFIKTPGVINKWIEKIHAVDNHSILVGTSNHGVKSFDTKELSYKDLLTYNADKTAIFARDFIQSTPDEYWIATESGIFIYNIQTSHITNLRKNYTNPYSLSDNAVYSLLKDKEGGIWAGTYFGGANYFPVQYTPFKKYFPDYSSHSLSGNAVREICADSSGNLWIGTEDAGLNKLDTSTGHFTQFKPTGTSAGISYSNIHGLLVRNNELWIGTFEHGLNIMDIRTGKVIKYYPQENTSQTLKSNFIVTLINTRDGNIYIGTRNGLYRFDFKKESFINIPEIPSNSFVHSILEDKKGLLWIGTLGNGLFYYDPVKGISGKMMHQASNKNSISSNSITTIFEDSSGTLWIGTEGGGVCKFDRKNKHFISYQIKDGMPGSTVYKILEDSKKNLWMTTSRGLISLNPRTAKMTVFTVSSGLLSDQFNYNSGYKDAAGTMYFGSVKGLISFNPDKFIENNYEAPLQITNILVNNQDMVAGRNHSPLDKSILYTRKLTLKHDQSSLAIDFAALSFTAPEVVQYTYFMEGLDKEWTFLKNKRRVYFTNLLPGNYVFKVKVAGLEGEWKGDETTLAIEILPPFWASNQAYILYILFLCLVAYFLFKYYHNKVDEKNKRNIESLEHLKEKEIYRAKIEFYTNVAHEIKTPITLIKAPLEKVLRNTGDNDKNIFNLKLMEKSTEKLIALTNQLLDFRKVEMNSLQLSFVHLNITDFINETNTSFGPFADQKRTSVKLIFPEENVFADVDPDAFQKILNNLYLNAINYSEGIVLIRLTGDKTKESFSLEFMNNGQLIDRSFSERIFDPFFRIKNTGYPGNGLGLALSRSLTLLHNGTLELDSPENGLNVFTLIIPIQRK